MISLKNRKQENIGVVLKEVEKPTFQCTDISIILETFYTNFIIDVAFFISKYYVCSIGESLGLFIPFKKQSVPNISKNNFDTKIILSKKQQEAFEFIEKNKRSLLFANTGSGKTEIYLKVIEKALNDGKNCVYLLPEIALTPQMEKRLKKVFGEAIAIWHSKISQKRKMRF